jgi:hypothetical protein
MLKTYKVQSNIGKVKYVVSFHNGISTHKDGSRFFDIRTFKNKKVMNKFITELIKDGYKEEPVITY